MTRFTDMEAWNLCRAIAIEVQQDNWQKAVWLIRQVEGGEVLIRRDNAEGKTQSNHPAG